MNNTKSNPLVAQLPAIGLILGVLLGSFIGMLFQVNIGTAMMVGILAGVALGGLVRVVASMRRATPELDDEDLVNPEYLN